jgi:hypothetical protein
MCDYAKTKNHHGERMCAENIHLKAFWRRILVSSFGQSYGKGIKVKVRESGSTPQTRRCIRRVFFCLDPGCPRPSPQRSWRAMISIVPWAITQFRLGA